MKIPLRIALLREYLNLLRGYWRDFRRYSAHACVGYNRLHMDPGQLEGRIIATYHVIEKGLSMPEFRAGFGIPMLSGLIRMLREAESSCEWETNVNIQTARKVVHEYIVRHEEIEYELDEKLSAHDLKFAKGIQRSLQVEAGSKSYTRGHYFDASQAPFPEFARSRHSCRVFDPSKKVDPAVIRSAVEVARFAPSVCNRQCWRAHVFQDKKMVEKLLQFQGGNRGFGHTIPCVVVLTAGLKVFSGYAERSQGFLDGGLFGMSLMYALHHQNLGCVPLCWLVPLKEDEKFRKVAGIPDDEIVLMFLGVGTPVENFLAPASQRRSVDELVRFH
ncbi:nitroreductase family protein [Akkermansiaceae bacterium]|nr:nitroreductase family protein [Akkermansiaceae bacterium]MDB4727022.1 nitroreductase family protein [bacterium]